MPTREVKESRRLTGPSVLWDHPGAILDIEIESSEREAAVRTWERRARRLLDAVGWSDQRLTHRVYPGGVSLAISAPLDALYAATALNEAAWEQTERQLDGGEPGDDGAESTPGTLLRTIAEESNPSLIALQTAARERGVAFLTDDDHASVGLGSGSLTWAVDKIPAADRIPWSRVRDVPIALVTGTNGKTTTTRLLATMVTASHQVPGVSSTDWLKVGDETLDLGDWSGPGGARSILRDRRVDVAVLETARGGMLRRGLGVTDADVAAILNVAEDHLGEWGVEDLAALVEAKFVVARAARHLVLNADDGEVVERAGRADATGSDVPRPGTGVTWFGLEVDPALARRELDAGRTLLTVRDDSLCELREASAASPSRIFCRVDEIPIALGGTARHNVSNALAAIGLALRLGIADEAIREGLRTFHSDPSENPGRLNRFELDGVRVLVDFAHNPHGLQALLEMAAALPAERRLVLIGQAGDRTDSSIRDLVRIVWRARPERIIVREMEKYLRGRERGEIPRMITEELAALGAPEQIVGHADSELAGVRQALEWAKPGDLLLVLTHESRDKVLELCGELEARAWRPGEPLPSIV